jgi:hypothetical protein
MLLQVLSLYGIGLREWEQSTAGLRGFTGRFLRVSDPINSSKPPASPHVPHAQRLNPHCFPAPHERMSAAASRSRTCARATSSSSRSCVARPTLPSGAAWRAACLASPRHRPGTGHSFSRLAPPQAGCARARQPPLQASRWRGARQPGEGLARDRGHGRCKHPRTPATRPPPHTHNHPRAQPSAQGLPAFAHVLLTILVGCCASHDSPRACRWRCAGWGTGWGAGWGAGARTPTPPPSRHPPTRTPTRTCPMTHGRRWQPLPCSRGPGTAALARCGATRRAWPLLPHPWVAATIDSLCCEPVPRQP